MDKNRTFLFISVLLLLVFFSQRCEAATLFQQVGVASSPNPVGSGARAVGMGGAFIAIADDATAASWNPAGLIQLERPEISVVGAYFRQKEEFSSETNPESNTTSKIDDVNLNYFSATYPFHFHRNIVISLNYQRLYEFKRSFVTSVDFSSAGLDLTQEKTFHQDGYLGALGLAAAIEITPRLSLGLTVNIWTGQLPWENGWTEQYSERSVGVQGLVPFRIDTQYFEKYSDFRGINANVGLLWNMTANLTLGAVVKTPFKATLDHDFNFAQTSFFGPPINTTITSRQRIVDETELQMPLSLGLGLAWRLSDALSFALDVYWTRWNEYILTDSRGNKFSPIDGRPENESDVKNTTQVRIGAEYLLISEKRKAVFPLRAGLFYDPEPGENKLRDFYGIAVGAGLAYKRVVFDLAYQLRWGSNVDTGNLIRNSEADILQHTFLASLILYF
jgi:long-subunit fatty acid transport protein